jgi:hypothetical protein
MSYGIGHQVGIKASPEEKAAENIDFSAETQKKFNWCLVIPIHDSSHRTRKSLHRFEASQE